MKHIRSYQYILPGTIVFSIFLMLIGICIGDASEILPGLWKIVTMQDLLITDYIDIAGPAAAFVNAGLVTIISICLIWLAKDPFNGFTIVEMGLMAGFSLFGKNLFNIWPIILGTWLYARYQPGAVFQIRLRGAAFYIPCAAGELYGAGQRSCQYPAGGADRRGRGLSAAQPFGLHL